MRDFLCDLMGHAAWADAVYFHQWGKSPGAITRNCAAAAAISSAWSGGS